MIKNTISQITNEQFHQSEQHPNKELFTKINSLIYMQKYEYSTIGNFHINHNEDALVSTELGNHHHLIAVMDGCSMGKESHFAATLIAKILRKIAIQIGYRAFIEPTEITTKAYLEEIMKLLFEDLKSIKNQLMLTREETLSTLILGIVHLAKREAELLAIGDGLICYNQKYFEYEQEDQPDYLGYHLHESFDHWFKLQTQRLSLTDINDLSISTDGIFTFKAFDNQVSSAISEQALIDFLLINDQEANLENMLTKKMRWIEKNYGLKPSDDLSLIRIILN